MPDNFEADTEWNDILREKGIIPPKKKDEAEITEDQIVEMIDKAVKQKYGQKDLEDRDLDELAELEDEEDDRVLEAYRRQRMAEMRAQAAREIYGSVTQISKPDYTREVTDASKQAYVVVHLFQQPLIPCKAVNAHLDTLATRHRSTKFVKIVADLCIPNYPDRNCPTLIVYKDGDIVANLVGPSRCGGQQPSLSDIEGILALTGAIPPAIKQQERKQKRDDESDEDDY